MQLQLFTLFLIKLVVAYNITQHANWNLLDHEDCGESLSDRIIGGSQASLGEFPWMARIGYSSLKSPKKDVLFKCGGSLINPQYCVTAAHCVVGIGDLKPVLVRLGENYADSEVDCEDNVCAPPVQDFIPHKIYYHNRFQSRGVSNDIALIRLDRPATFNDYVGAICLPYGPLLTKNYTGTYMDVAGWGKSEKYNYTSSQKLLHVKIPIVDPVLCNTHFRMAIMDDSQFCAGGQNGYDSCGGDSGGPLMKPDVVDGPPQYFLMGVVSFGSKHCGSDAPAIYTDVRKHLRWILNLIEP